MIIITGYATVETAIEAMKLGAYDFIPKPFKPDELRITVRRARERLDLIEQTRRLEAERRRSLADLHAEQSRTRTIIRALPIGVVVTGSDGKVALMNPAFRHLMGLGMDKPPGEPIREYVSDPGFCEMALAASGAGAHGASCPIGTYELNTDQGRCFMCRATPILGDEDEHLGAVLVCADMTSYKALDQLKSEFVAKVSHEIRSPLSTILFQLKVLGNEGVDEARGGDFQRLLSRAQQRTESLISFVSDLLDLSRIESGMAYADHQELPLARVLKDVVQAHEAPGPGKRAKPGAGASGRGAAQPAGRSPGPGEHIRQPGGQCHQIHPPRRLGANQGLAAGAGRSAGGGAGQRLWHPPGYAGQGF